MSTLTIADRQEPHFRRAWMRALAMVTGRHLPPEVVEDAYRTGTPATVIAAIPWLPFMAELVDRLTPAYRAVMVAAGGIGEENVPEGDPHQAIAKADFNFNGLNPRATQWILRHSGDLVRNVTAESQQAIRAIVLDMFQRGIPAETGARIIREHIGLTQRQSAALWRFQLGFQDKLTTGTLSQTEVNAKVRDYRTQLLASRAKMIARTESMTASNQGQQEAWLQASEQGYLGDDAMREWIITDDERLCQVCAPVPKRGPVGLQESFILGDGSSLMVPPAHPSCRCTTRLVFGRQRSAA